MLTDLDGTLVPTPHKAHGHYTPLNESPCFAPICTWLRRGGNVCVVTTADRRVIDQVFVPLKDLLAELKANAEAAATSPSDIHSSNLLLSLYTGAVLYRCSAENGVVEVEGYCSRQTAPETAIAITTKSVSNQKSGSHVARSGGGTCMDEPTYSALLEILHKVFLQFAEEMLRDRRPDLSAQMSKRYQHMWATLRRHLKKRYDTERSNFTEGNDKRRFRDLEPFIENEAEWMVQYLRRRKALLTRVGIIRKEILDPIGTPVKGNRHAYHERQKRHSLRAAAQPNGARDELAEDVSTKEMRAIEDDLKGSGEPQPQSSASSSSPSSSGSTLGGDGGSVAEDSGVSADSRIAQVIVVGMPLRCYDEFFGPYHKHFEDVLGVQPIPQPNSVVFAKFGVGKGTCVDYLAEPCDGRPDNKTLASSPSFNGVANLQRSVGLGDNPHSADKELCINPNLTFVSLETASAPRRAPSNALSHTTPMLAAHTVPVVDVSQYASHMLHVGREEDGCADFLNHLLSLMQEHHDNKTKSDLPYWSAGNDASNGRLVNERMFQHCVKIAATKAKILHHTKHVHGGSRL